jgi:hypothetical protein
MSTEYEIFEKWMDKVQPEVLSGAEVNVPIKSLDTYEKLVVRARIAESQDALPESVPLRVVSDLGEKRGSAYIEILEDLGEDALSMSAGG